MQLKMITALWCLIVLTACAQSEIPGPTTDDDVQALEQLITEGWPSAALAADPIQYVNFLSDEFVYLAPGYPAFVSKTELSQWLQGAFEFATYEFSFSVDEIVVNGDWAYARYQVSVISSPKAEGPTTQTDRKYLDIWQRQTDGKWKCHRHMWNDIGPSLEID